MSNEFKPDGGLHGDPPLPASTGSSAAATDFQLTAKEELAVIVQRLDKHADDAKDQKAKIRIELAKDLIRQAIIWR